MNTAGLLDLKKHPSKKKKKKKKKKHIINRDNKTYEWFQFYYGSDFDVSNLNS